MLKQSQLEAYLGRPLTTLEVKNLKTHLRITSSRLDELLCMSLCSDGDTKTYDGRLGYKLLYIDPISDVTSVQVNGETVLPENYTLKQWDNRNATWYNVIEFADVMDGDVEIEGTWGFPELPDDLALLYSRLFDQYSIEQNTGQRVKSKKIEDFSVTYADPISNTELVQQNASIINKYSICRLGEVRHGEVSDGHLYSLS